MTNLVVQDISVEDSYEKLHETGLFFQKKTVESLLAFAVVVKTLRDKCDSEKDEEKDFNSMCLDFWGLSQSGASQMLKVGQRANDFFKHLEKLPASSRALYELATIPPKKLEESIELGLVNPNLSVTEAKSLKITFKEEKQAKKETPPVEDNPFSEEALRAEEKPVIEGEVVVIEDKPTKKRMKAPEAIEILNINVKSYYNEAKKGGLFSAEVLAEALYVLTGEKI